MIDASLHYTWPRFSRIIVVASAFAAVLHGGVAALSAPPPAAAGLVARASAVDSPGDVLGDPPRKASTCAPLQRVRLVPLGADDSNEFHETDDFAGDFFEIRLGQSPGSSDVWQASARQASSCCNTRSFFPRGPPVRV